MRTALLTTALLVGFAIPSFAQNPGGNYEPQGGMNMNQMRGGPGEGGPMGFMGRERMDMMMRAARELAAGAFFRFKRGDDEVDIHCPPNINLQGCVAAANDLMSNLQRTASAGGGSSGGGQSGQSGGGSSQQGGGSSQQ